MIIADLVVAVRAELGNVNVDMKEVSNDDIERNSKHIIGRICDRITTKAKRYITSEENVGDYIVPEGVLRIQKVYQWDEYTTDLSNIGDVAATGGVNNGITGNEYYNFPSLWKIEQLRRARGLPKVSYEFDIVTMTLTIYPTPIEDDNKYYYVSIERPQWVIGVVPTTFEGLLTTGTTWKCMEQMAMARSTLGGVMRAGGMVTYPATEIFGISEKKKKEFDTMLGIKALLYSR